jgi:hypothetical protein
MPFRTPKIDREWLTTFILAGICAAAICSGRGRDGGAPFLKGAGLTSLGADGDQ